MAEPEIKREAFLEYLKVHYPYLYDVEMEADRIITDSGFGDISIVLKIQNKRVTYGEVLGGARRQYVFSGPNKKFT